MDNTTEIIHRDNWIFRIRRPADGNKHPVILLFHGKTGDENSMWIFTHRFPKDALIISPRGLYAQKSKGFGWSLEEDFPSIKIESFLPILHQLFDAMTKAFSELGNIERMRICGFSQGAALAYALALFFPEKIYSLAGLSGFMPDGAENYISNKPLIGKSVFIAHGTEDKLVSVEHSLRVIEILTLAGAEVSYCEDHVGHKLSADCFRGLGEFLNQY